MATTTTNFGWSIPQSTDLVKDGATAIAALGNGVDTSMAELKGGTTGQILSKTSGTDMDFTWVTPNPGDITGVTAGTGLSGGGTSGDVTLSVDSTYAGLTNYLKNANPIINSNFSVWQRGTSIACSSTAYTADRWNGYRAVAGATVSRQATGDSTNLAFIQYCARVQRNSGNTATNAIYFAQSLETVDSIPFAGKIITISFYARKGSNFSESGSVINCSVITGTGTDQNNTTGAYTGVATPLSQNATLTTTWQRFSYSATLAATATEITTQFYYTPVGTASTNDYFEITGVQIDLGSVALPYRPNGATYQAELAACQRYYVRYASGTIGNNSTICNVAYVNSTTQEGVLSFPTEMRTSPTIDQATGTNYFTNNNGDAFNSLTIDKASPRAVSIYNATESSGTAGFSTWISTNNASAYLGFSAEL